MESAKESVDLMATMDMPPEFKTAEPLLLSEVTFLLNHKQSQGEVIDYGGRGIFDQTSDYCKKFFYFKTAEAMGAVRNTLSTTAGLDSVELALVGSIVPRDYDEAVALFPSLANKDRQLIEDALVEINQQKDALG